MNTALFLCLAVIGITFSVTEAQGKNLDQNINNSASELLQQGPNWFLTEHCFLKVLHICNLQRTF